MRLVYQKRQRPVLSSHLDCFILILCTITPVPRIQQWVALISVIATLFFTQPHIVEQVFFHLVRRRMAGPLNVYSASTPRRPSTETENGQKGGVAGVKLPGISYSSPSPLSGVTSPSSCSGRRGHQRSRHAYHEYCPSLSFIVCGSSGLPYATISTQPWEDFLE